MNDAVVSALVGLGTGFLVGNRTSKENSDLNQDALNLQRSINEALISSIKYEATIKKLKEDLLLVENSGPTNDFLKLQLADLQDNYDMLMNYARSKIPDLPTSFVVAETPVEGLHFNPNLVFDRSKSDRNITLVNGVISIKGVRNFKVPVYVVEAGVLHELKSHANSSLSSRILQLTTGDASCQLKIGPNEKIMNPAGAIVNPVAEPLLLVEFDKSVDLVSLLNNIVIGYSRSISNARWDVFSSGFVGLYRRNILAFKAFCIYDYQNYYLANLVLKALVNSQQLPVLSVTVVDSLSATIPIYSGVVNNFMTASYKLANKSVVFE